MTSQPDDLDARIADLEGALAGAPDAARRRALGLELATCLAARYVRFDGPDGDRVRAEELVAEVLDAPETSAQDRQTASMVRVTLTMVSATPAEALRGHGPDLDSDALRRTGEWQQATDPDALLAGLGRLVEQLDAVDPEGLPPEIRWSLDSVRAMSGLLGDVARPGWDGNVAKEVSAGLRDTVQQAPAGAPGLALMRGLVEWVDPSSDPVAELHAAIAGLPGDTVLVPLLQGDLAKAVLRNAGPGGLPRATELLKAASTGMAPDHPLRDGIESMLVGALVATAGSDPTPEQKDTARRLAADLVARSGPSAGPERRGADLFLTALVGLLGGLTGDDRDVTAAVRHLVEAIAVLPPGNELRMVAVSQLGAVLADRHLVDGLLENADTAVHLLEHAVRVVGTGSDGAFIACVAAVARVNRAVRRDDGFELATAADDLRDALAGLPAGRELRSNFELVLRVAELRTAVATGADVAAAVAGVRQVAAGTPPVGVPGTVVATMVDALDVLGGLSGAGPAATAAAVGRLEAGLDGPAAPPHQRAAQLALAGKSYLAAVATGVEIAGAPDRAVAHLQEALDLLGEHRSDALRAGVLSDLAVALRVRGDRGESRRTGLASLEAYAAIVLLQSGVAHGVLTARGAAAEATRLMRWALADGDLHGAVQAVELGRGLALHAATSTAEVPALLEGADRGDLAEAWRRDARAREHDPAPWTAGPGAQEPDYARAADDLRHRVLEVLRTTPEGRPLFRPPSPRAIGRALATLGRDALAYLVPGDAAVAGQLLLIDRDGAVTAAAAPGLRVEPAGPVAAYLDTPRSGEPGQAAVWRAALGRMCSWAGPVATVPLLAAVGGRSGPPRVVVVPGGPLGVVPWAATPVSGEGEPVRRACEEAVFSTAASGRQLLDVARRDALLLDRAPVLVGDPTGDLPGARSEVAALAGAFYPGARVLGGLDGTADPATPDAVLAALFARPPGATGPGVSLLHLGCHARTGTTPGAAVLDLTTPLPLTTLLRRGTNRVPFDAGPTVVAAACDSDATWEDFDEALTLATAFLAAGAVTVVGARWAVPDRLTAVAMFALHHFLAQGEPPADALRLAQLWMLDPGRRPLPGMPGDIAQYAGRRPLADIAVWAAFGHHGR